ncbi:MAG: hypothetical protein HEQ27_07640 [Dolichospermum sp. JUN01]|jgi:hypothetical protein|uniref:hypothetical protein n=1 Tax=Nostocales TaxID=1161 RepID=UPI0007FF7A0C|nr:MULTISPECIES: hypothetical protein [Nostocales]MBO1056393.1 hypothetical protein [Dolichospermum sp. JUN01]QSV54768.1 MAG: hypothetical protein HEP80_13700 [Dolichospermum sp. UKL201]MDB9466919.1 hypothetical protein [Dolichospermum circinale CS-539/09]MDB9472149.1 hypothetical protein [Dolichospermum circinale CS-539]OBQ02357.1 MAG: hypothetical protein AN490_18915 [Anabaena sp. AL09]
MSWLEHHTRSEKYASQAEDLGRRGEFNRAAELYCLAADAEVCALEDLAHNKTRTIGITAVSSASLYFKAREFKQAKRIAHRYLATELLPPFAVEQLEELIQVIRFEESLAKSGIEFLEGEVLVSVSGGEVIYGGAPLDLILDKVKDISNIFYRTTEWLLEKEFRKGGAPSPEVKNLCNPWLLQAPPGSYQFAVRVRKPQEQLSFPFMKDMELQVEQITKKFLEVVGGATQDPEGKLVEIVPDKEYRDTFLKLTRKLAPPATGKSFSQIEIKSANNLVEPPVVIIPDTRKVITSVLKKTDSISPIFSEQQIIQLRGTLRGLQLDNDWIEVKVNGENKKIYDVKEEIDDVIGSMVNRQVVVDVVERLDRSSEKRYSFRDLQAEED